jgi:hypothetical protein
LLSIVADADRTIRVTENEVVVGVVDRGDVVRALVEDD